VARLRITTNVEGAEVFVDDISVGHSPLAEPVLVNAGLRRVSVSKDGYPVTAKSVTVAGGDKVDVSVELSERSTATNVEPRERPERGKLTHRPSEPPPPTGTPTRVWVGLAVTSVLAVGTTALALVTVGAKHDFDSELGKPTTRQHLDQTRSRLVT